MAKRSPILGYNHNVLYRGLIFHVQTEDSGLMSPHLFTHLFHSGVIISTRKLVYDAGSDEGAIKALMQSQHKAVMKDLKRHTFDDKIDVYLAGTPGLLPREAPGADGAAPVAAPVAAPAVEAVTPEPIVMPEISRTSTPPPIPLAAKSRADTEHDPNPRGSVPSRTQTVERASSTSAAPQTWPVRTGRAPGPPPPEDLDPATISDSTAASVAAAIAAANAHTRANEFRVDSSPDIEIQLELDDPDDDELIQLDEPRGRRARDTAVEMPIELGFESDGIPGMLGSSLSAGHRSESQQQMPPPPSASRPSSVGASALPARTVTRVPPRAITASGIVSRPLPIDERSRPESDAIELYATGTPPVDPAPGAYERPGVYSQHRRPTRAPIDVRTEGADRSGPMAIPAGLGRPGRASQGPGYGSTVTPATGVPRTLSPQVFPQVSPQVADAISARTATASRAATPTASRASSTSGGVVMTRPAVIVGAPSKSSSPAPRVRKAREDEGRGFGQGLISEKSLDEVILAYLSEDEK